jgi:rubrerythrin
MDLPDYADLFFKLLVASIISLGWAAIFYPLIRKSQKSWHTLIILTSILSFSTLLLKELLDKFNPPFAEIFTYLLGIFFSIALIYLLFIFKSKRLEVLPKEDLSFRNYKIKTEIHMRHLFQIAILIEEEGKQFYGKIAKKASDIKSKKFWQKLAKDEVDHKRLFQRALSRWLPIPSDKETLESFIQELKANGLFSNSPAPDATEEDVIKYAIQQEEKTADFYLSFENAFPDAWKRMHIHNLVMIERGHAKDLKTFSRT